MYQPNQNDIAFAKAIVDMLNDGGVWGLPATSMIYRIDKVAKTLTLVDRGDGTHIYLHERNREVFREVGYTVCDETVSVESN